MSDPHHHLIKALRDNLENSRGHHNTRHFIVYFFLLYYLFFILQCKCALLYYNLLIAKGICKVNTVFLGYGFYLLKLGNI